MSPLGWRDAIVRRLVSARFSDGLAPAYLMELDAAHASLFLPEIGESLILLARPEQDPRAVELTRRQLRHAIETTRPARVHVAVIGGGAEARKLCRAEQPFLQLDRRVAVHHLSDDGALWNGGRRCRSLDAAVVEVRREVAHGLVPAALNLTEIVAAREASRRLASEEQAMAKTLSRRRVPATVWFIAACVLVFALEAILGGSADPNVLLLCRMGSVNRAGLLDGEWWRLLAPVFLHASLLHIAVNAWSLWVLGSLVERLFGTARFVVLYFVGGICSSLASATFNGGTSVGASGAIFALMGAMVAVALRPQGLLPPMVVVRLRRSLWPPLLANVAISTLPAVDWYAHLGGFVAGLAIVGSGVLARGVPSLVHVAPVPSRGWRTAALASVLAMAASVVVAIGEGRPWDRAVGPMTSVVLPGSRLVIDAPAKLPLTQLAPFGNQYGIALGSLPRTELGVVVLVVPDSPVASLTLLGLMESLRDRVSSLQEPGFTPEAPPSLESRPEGPVAMVRCDRDDGVIKDTWLTYRDGAWVRIDVAFEPRTDPAWQALSPTFVSSLRAQVVHP